MVHSRGGVFLPRAMGDDWAGGGRRRVREAQSTGVIASYPGSEPKLVPERSPLLPPPAHRQKSQQRHTPTGRYIPSALREVDWLLRIFERFGQGDRRAIAGPAVRRSATTRDGTALGDLFGVPFAGDERAVTPRGLGIARSSLHAGDGDRCRIARPLRRGISPIAPCRWRGDVRNLSPIIACAPGRGRSREPGEAKTAHPACWRQAESEASTSADVSDSSRPIHPHLFQTEQAENAWCSTAVAKFRAVLFFIDFTTDTIVLIKIKTDTKTFLQSFAADQPTGWFVPIKPFHLERRILRFELATTSSQTISNNT